MSDNKVATIHLGDVIYADIDSNEYLREIHDNLLYNYAAKMLNIFDQTSRPVDKIDALRFADLLSKSTHSTNSDQHKMWAQEIITLLCSIYPDDPAVSYYAGSVLTSTGNYQGRNLVAKDYQSGAVLDRMYSEYSKELLTIPAMPEFQFLRAQKQVYDHLTDQYFSYSGPTSMGKSFIVRMFLKSQVESGVEKNFALIVPTKALINEVTSKIINDLKENLKKYNYRLVTSAGALVLKEQHNFIFVLTPERLLYLLISNPDLELHYLFVDEAHKLSEVDSRGPFYYKVIDKLVERKNKPHVIFASPNIPNPEIYLRSIPDIETPEKWKLASSFSPVTQFKFLISFRQRSISMFNDYSRTLTKIAQFTGEISLDTILPLVSRDSDGRIKQNIVYCSSIAQAVNLARSYANKIPTVTANQDIWTLSKEIKQEVHGDYFLAELITKGVAYHIGYLPSTIRMRIEELFRSGAITTIFCTSTLVEGVNMPADNLFITSYKKGYAYMDAVDFRNLIGRVGRIEYNLYGNVFLVSMNDKVKEEKFEELLKEKIPEQKLSIESGLTNAQKKSVVKALVNGEIEFDKHPHNQPEESYTLMRKFALILLRDITKGRDSLVHREFAPFLTEHDEEKIKANFTQKSATPDDDINVSVDQTENLTSAIARGMSYPTLDINGNVDYNELMNFLERMCRVFKWEKYERQTLGRVSKKTGKHGMLRWYAVILIQWIQGMGLSNIMNKAIEYKRNDSEATVRIDGKPVKYDDSREHRNIVIADTLDVIENVILFSISNYFLRFSNEYKRFHKVESFKNDWYEYVEYGTTNPLTILLQRSGFSRETSTYIRQHRREYVVMAEDGGVKLRRTLLQSRNLGAARESADIQYNMPEIFVD